MCNNIDEDAIPNRSLARSAPQSNDKTEIKTLAKARNHPEETGSQKI